MAELKRKQIYDFRERFQMVSEGFFAGKMPTPARFDEPNPWLAGAGGSDRTD
ncbi:hypothetical protein [Pseudomonas sp. G2-4]|uniref:hypothetical protein n=1 Tax=Pseudomonas sp. G2-4 TaxID=1506334 RepID=UPI0024B928AD|nr:hypothetical protein [Pseudomonas sp. G2-4]WHS60466.1 hypothetical protein QNH97_00040 [Pseudomonas sp. G2-4]